MDEEQKQNAILERLKEMGIQVAQSLFTLSWKDVARVMVETEGFDNAANLPTDILVHTLNTVQDGLEYLDWYANIQNNLRLAEITPLPTKPVNTEDGHLESEYEDRVSGSDG
jgi:uncharacterized protein with GYD domain